MTDHAPFAAAVCSPLPPTRNGIADYTAELLAPLHEALGGVVGVIAAGAPPPTLEAASSHVAILRAPSFDALMQCGAGASVTPIYQVGNNPDHVFMLPRLARYPGVLVLHDASLNFLLLHATTELGRPSALSDLYALDQGARGLRLYQDQWEAGLGGQGLPKELALARPLLERSRAVIVHSEFSARLARQTCPDVPVFVAPHHVSPAIAASAWRTRAAARERLMLPSDDFIALSIGFATPAKQIGPAMVALGRAKPDNAPITFVVAGAHDPRSYDLTPYIQRSGLQGKVLMRGYVPEAAFVDYIAAADLVFNLRHPYGGETSGTLARALGMGTACVVTDVGAFSELPDGVALKVPYSEPYEDRLAQAIAPLLADPQHLVALKQGALRFARSAWSIDKTVATYQEAIEATRRVGPPTRHCALRRIDLPAACAHRARGTRADFEALLAEVGGVSWPADRPSPRVAVASDDETMVETLRRALSPAGDATSLNIAAPHTWRGAFDAVGLALQSEQSDPVALSLALTRLLDQDCDALFFLSAPTARDAKAAAEALRGAGEEVGFLATSLSPPSENAEGTRAVVAMRWRRLSRLSGACS
jgi:glycosyltransferase involved in cell wall biosynthesis